MARKTKADALATRDSILEAAAKVFVECGVSKASLEGIGQAAGVTRGAVYWHFKNKYDVFVALLERVHKPFVEMVLEDLEKDHPDPLHQLEELCLRLLLDIENDEQKKRILTILFVKCEYSAENEQILASHADRRKKAFELFHQYFERARAKGHLPDRSDPCVLTVALFCYLNGMILESIRYPQCVNLKEQAGPMLRQFFLGFTAC